MTPFLLTRHRRTALFHVCFLLLYFSLTTTCHGAGVLRRESLRPEGLRCEGMANPCGVDKDHPVLSWECKALDPRMRGLRQTAYCVMVASSTEELNKADLWDSGKILSATGMVSYNGKELQSRQRFFWKVRVWDGNGRCSAWSKPHEWTMGVLSPEDWRGAWIASDLELMPYQKELRSWPDEDRDPKLCAKLWGLRGKITEMVKDVTEAPAVYFRKEFDAPKEIRRAVAFCSGLGCFNLYVNGCLAGPNLLDPAMCDYAKRVPYVVRDITDAIRRGKNTIGIVVGNGWFNPISPLFHGYYRAEFISPPQLKMDLEVEYTDGEKLVIATDSSWMFSTDGPIRYNCFAGGETYDARAEYPVESASLPTSAVGTEAHAPGFDDSKWKPVIPASAPTGKMAAQILYPVRRLEEIPAVKVEKVGDDKWRFTLRENAAGRPRLRFRAKAGQVITLESLGANGHTYGRYQTDIYIAKGEGEETYEPSLTYHGFGAVDVSGLGYEPKVEDLVGVIVATDLPVVGGFSCSDERLNRLQEVFRRTVYNYIIHLPNDPVREKSCWTQDVWTQLLTQSWFYDVGPTYREWQRDFLEGMCPDGYVPPVIPGRFEAPDINGPWWGGVMVYTPWLHYLIHGDPSVLSENYDGMKKHFAYLENLCGDEKTRADWGCSARVRGKDILWWGLGDWLAVEKPKARVEFTSTAALAWFARILAETASILNRDDDKAFYERRAEEIRKAFNATFLNSETGAYDVAGKQTVQSLPLSLDLVPAEARGKVVDRLVKAIEEADNHIGCGFVGTPILLTTLSDIGRGDLAWTIATQPDAPGFFANVRQGTYSEAWDGGGVQMPSLAAPIHRWFMECLAGIRPASSGLRSCVLRPDLVGGLTWVKAWHDGPNGRISSAWSIEDKVFRWEVSIPPNTVAIIHVPVSDSEAVKESGAPASKAKGLRSLKFENGHALFEAGSGDYKFEATIR